MKCLDGEILKEGNNICITLAMNEVARQYGFGRVFWLPDNDARGMIEGTRAVRNPLRGLRLRS